LTALSPIAFRTFRDNSRSRDHGYALLACLPQCFPRCFLGGSAGAAAYVAALAGRGGPAGRARLVASGAASPVPGWCFSWDFAWRTVWSFLWSIAWVLTRVLPRILLRIFLRNCPRDCHSQVEPSGAWPVIHPGLCPVIRSVLRSFSTRSVARTSRVPPSRLETRGEVRSSLDPLESPDPVRNGCAGSTEHSTPLLSNVRGHLASKATT